MKDMGKRLVPNDDKIKFNPLQIVYVIIGLPCLVFIQVKCSVGSVENAKLFVAEMEMMRQFGPMYLRPHFVGYSSSGKVSSNTNVRSHCTSYTYNHWDQLHSYKIKIGVTYLSSLVRQTMHRMKVT